MEKIYAVTVAHYDYHGDSRNPYWRWSDEPDVYISATPEEMQKYVDEFNAGIVANTIVEYSGKVTKEFEYIARHEKRVEMLASMSAEEKATLDVRDPDPSVPVRAQERITEFQNTIERLETNSLMTIIDRGWIDKQLHADAIEIMTIAEAANSFK